MFDFFIASASSVLSNLYVLLGIQILGFSLKLLVLLFSAYQFIKARKHSWSPLAIMGVIAGSAFEDFAWVASLLHKTGFISFFFKQIFVRCGWIAHVTMYQSLSLFVDSFSHNSRQLKWYQYFFLAISLTITGLFIYLIIMKTPDERLFEIMLQSYTAQYTLLVLIPFTVIMSLHNEWQRDLPRILHYQLNTLIKFFLFPLIIINIWQLYPFNFSGPHLTSNMAVVGLSTLISLFTIYFCIRNIIGLRFFDIHGHVHEPNPHRFYFVRDFKNVLGGLGNVSHISEIKLLLQHFFHTAFHIKPQGIMLYLRSTQQFASEQEARSSTLLTMHDMIIEDFINQPAHEAAQQNGSLQLLKEQQIFIKDEIEYTHFYHPTHTTHVILQFLEQLNADIFLPLYEEQKIIGAIVIERDSRTKKLYTDAERDEMVVFTSYLSKIIYLLQNRNLNELLKQRKDIAEELYLKHQEIRQYKESIRSFLRVNKDEQHIGIIFYKNRKFTFGNPAAQEMLGVDPNEHAGDAVSRHLKNLATQVMLYKATSTIMVPNLQGKKIVVTAIPQGDSDGAVITIHYPEISDVIKRLIDHIKDPSQWDYLLYLESTESGKLINSLIPGNTETLLNFKMELLKAALTKKAVLLDIPQDDLLNTVELLHHISLRETLYTLDVPQPITTPDTTIKLFGINPIFSVQYTQPIIEKLNKTGTLFIKNVHNLDRESQEILAELIRYGFYRMYKSDRKVQADVRIICSSHQNLTQWVQEGRFSSQLFNELRKTNIIFPDLEALTKEEIDDLMQGFSEQAVAHSITQKFLALSGKDKEKIIDQKPNSLAELKSKINNQLVVKLKKQELVKDIQFDAAYNINDPELIQAARLGKKALKNEHVMRQLWEKFHCQNKIALFLGVNRSSVHRRCKAYELI